MINLIKKINCKISELIILCLIAGAIFLILAILIILYPAIIQYLFVIAFGTFAALCFIVAERIYRLKHMLNDITKFIKK